MSEEFQLFISSTVNDLAAVRQELANRLRQPGRIIRCSEDKTFPVEPGLTSHDACLAVVRRCHGFALLIGTRFGGEYLSQGKSITWREWEEACRTGLTPIVLVNRKTNELCRMISKQRSALQKANPAASISDLDEVLGRKLKRKLTAYHQAPALQRFVDTVRKGHTDNWIKLIGMGRRVRQLNTSSSTWPSKPLLASAADVMRSNCCGRWVGLSQI